MQTVNFADIGRIGYMRAWELQERLFKAIVEYKIRKRKEPACSEPAPPQWLLFCEHPHVYTLGKSGDESHLLIGGDELRRKNAEYVRTNRGGDITYHGPGQLVGYPILDLECFFTDIHRYLRCLEEAVILTLAGYGVGAGRIGGLTGVWLDAGHPERARKICALGVRTSRWVTMHGFAFNVNSDLSYFGNIVPCGIAGKAVTSLSMELGAEADFEEVKSRLKNHIAGLFGMDLRDAGREAATGQEGVLRA